MMYIYHKKNRLSVIVKCLSVPTKFDLFAPWISIRWLSGFTVNDHSEFMNLLLHNSWSCSSAEYVVCYTSLHACKCQACVKQNMLPCATPAPDYSDHNILLALFTHQAKETLHYLDCNTIKTSNKPANFQSGLLTDKLPPWQMLSLAVHVCHKLISSSSRK